MDIYKLKRDVELWFEFLKTDLNILLVFHKKDNYIEPHIWLDNVAYQIAHYIRHKLKEHHINYSWTTIVEKMQSKQVSIKKDLRKYIPNSSQLCQLIKKKFRPPDLLIDNQIVTYCLS